MFGGMWILRIPLRTRHQLSQPWLQIMARPEKRLWKPSAGHTVKPWACRRPSRKGVEYVDRQVRTEHTGGQLQVKRDQPPRRRREHRATEVCGRRGEAAESLGKAHLCDRLLLLGTRKILRDCGQCPWRGSTITTW